MHGHDNALARVVPSFQCSLGGNWTLGIDDNFASIPKNAAEGLTEKGSVPVSVPLEARRSTNRIEKECGPNAGMRNGPPHEWGVTRVAGTSFLSR